ncbi:PAF acetylhydrolase family protein [Aspergillus similis]
MILAIPCSVNSLIAGLFLLIGLGKTTITLPSSTGPCSVTLHASELVDKSRTDPYDPDGHKRSIMVTSFTPVNCGSISSRSYIPNATARFEDAFFQLFGVLPGTIESLRIQAQTQTQPFGLQSRDYPVVLFSPAVGTPRLMYTLLLQEIASHGFAVVAVDHPYDADIVGYPNGRTVLGILGNISTDEFAPAMDIRAQDMLFVLDELHDKNAARDIVPLSQISLDLERVTIFGHSLGGATAAQAMLLDNRFVGGINLDGSLWGPVVDEGLSRPFLLFGHANYNRTIDPSWARFWSHQRGWKLELQLAQSLHYTFSDFPVLVDAVSLSDVAREIIQANYAGTIGGLRAREVITAYIIAALQYFVSNHTSGLLSGPSVSYPEVTFV